MSSPSAGMKIPSSPSSPSVSVPPVVAEVAPVVSPLDPLASPVSAGSAFFESEVLASPSGFFDEVNVDFLQDETMSSDPNKRADRYRIEGR